MTDKEYIVGLMSRMEMARQQRTLVDHGDTELSYETACREYAFLFNLAKEITTRFTGDVDCMELTRLELFEKVKTL